MKASIKAEHLSLSVPVFLQHDRRADNWASMFFGAMFDPPRRGLACLLDDFNFEIGEGDRVALLGQNGAGKSTLLKVLNGAYAPTSGSLVVHGRSQALLNMSLGFNGQATVRENIFLRGTAMGLRTAYVREHIDDILNFADLPDKINHRLHTLSAGQRMRLGFAISTAIQQDILLLDEWISTGDANFKVKALERLQSRVDGSKIVVLASHRAGLLREICNKGMVIDHGRLLYFGEIESAIKFYQNLLAFQWASGSTKALVPGGGAALAFGYVDGVAVESDGEVQLKGWMASTQGPYPKYLAMEHGGKVYPMKQVRHVKRSDVVNRFGLADPLCGFQASFEIPSVHSITDLTHDMKVLAGISSDRIDTPLRHSENVSITLQAPSA